MKIKANSSNIHYMNSLREVVRRQSSNLVDLKHGSR